MTALAELDSTYTQLLRKLVISGTLSVPERKSLIVLGKMPIPKDDVAEVIRELLEQQRTFPALAQKTDDGGIYEGFVIEILAKNRCRLHSQRNYANDPHTQAEHSVFDFCESTEAIYKFIDLEWSRGIDGIQLRA